MALVQIGEKGITVKLTPAEKFWSISGDLEIPVTSIRGAEVTQGQKMFAGLTWAIRVGTALPFVYYAGRFYRPGGKDFLLVRPGKPTLQLNLSGKPYKRVMISMPNAEKVAEEVNSALAAC